jgi:uncharacterized RDD family membrane protein YckC
MKPRIHSLQRSIPRDRRPAPAQRRATEFAIDLVGLIVILVPILIFWIATP